MRYKKHPVDANGWTDWISPFPRGYKLACCDCGLVHEFQFRVLKVTKRFKDGSFISEVAGQQFKASFKARRNEQATAQRRRHMKKSGA